MAVAALPLQPFRANLREKMENLTSRKNKKLLYLRTLATDPAVRREAGEFLCEGMTTLDDALAAGAEIGMVLWAGKHRRR